MPELRKRVARRGRASSPVVATETAAAAVAAAVGTKKKAVKRKTQGAGPVVGNIIRTRAAVARAKAEAKAAEEAAKEAEAKEGLEGKEKSQLKEEEEEEKVVPVAEDKEEKMADKNGGLSAKGSAGQDDDGNAAPFPDKVTVKTQCFLREFMFVSVERFGV